MIGQYTQYLFERDMQYLSRSTQYTLRRKYDMVEVSAAYTFPFLGAQSLQFLNI